MGIKNNSLLKRNFKKIDTTMDFILEQSLGKNYIYRGQLDSS